MCKGFYSVYGARNQYNDMEMLFQKIYTTLRFSWSPCNLSFLATFVLSLLLGIPVFDFFGYNINVVRHLSRVHGKQVIKLRYVLISCNIWSSLHHMVKPFRMGQKHNSIKWLINSTIYKHKVNPSGGFFILHLYLHGNVNCAI